jgi:hypothetical protein
MLAHFSKIPQYQISQKTVQQFSCCYMQMTDMVKLIREFSQLSVAERINTAAHFFNFVKP